jgi:hypothetical protein
MANTPSYRKNLIWQIPLVIGLCIGAVVLMLALGAFQPATGERSVTLHVEASGGYARIDWNAGAQKQGKAATVTTPWDKTLKVKIGTEIFLTASNPTQTGALTCTILMNSKVWKKETTTAPKDGVACAGIVP